MFSPTLSSMTRMSNNRLSMLPRVVTGQHRRFSLRVFLLIVKKVPVILKGTVEASWSVINTGLFDSVLMSPFTIVGICLRLKKQCLV